MNPAPILQYMVKKTLKINRVRQRELSFFRQTCKFRFMRVSASLLLRCLSVLYVLYDLWDRFRMTHHSLSFTDSFFSFFFALISLSPVLSGSLLLLHFNSGLWYSAATLRKALINESVNSLLNLKSNHSVSFVTTLTRRTGLERKDEEMLQKK